MQVSEGRAFQRENKYKGPSHGLDWRYYTQKKKEEKKKNITRKKNSVTKEQLGKSEKNNSVGSLEENTEESQQPIKKTDGIRQKQKTKNTLIKLESQSRKSNIQIREFSERINRGRNYHRGTFLKNKSFQPKRAH